MNRGFLALRSRTCDGTCVPRKLFLRRHRFVNLPPSVRGQYGFTLIEVVICLLLVLFVGIATIGGITYTRLNLELEKQRLTALAYARQAMEAVQSLDTAESGNKKLVPFNSPDVNDLDAALSVEYYELNSDGTVNWSAPRSEPAINRPVYARVSVNWTPYGSMNRPQQVTMSTIVTRGID